RRLRPHRGDGRAGGLARRGAALRGAGEGGARRDRVARAPAPGAGARGGRRGGTLRLEVHRVDRVGLQGRNEAIHVLSHVRASETAEVGCELFHAAVQLLVELIEDVLIEDAAAGPVAVRAVEVDVPLVGSLLFPVGRVDELRVAVVADVEALSGSGGLLDRLFGG